LPADWEAELNGIHLPAPTTRPYNACRYSAEEAWDIMHVKEAVRDELTYIKLMMTWLRWKCADDLKYPTDPPRLIISPPE
jgi:hypothetical protein